MSAAALLQRLRAAGIGLEVQSGRLLARPVERLTQAHREQIRAYRAALVELLQTPPPATAPTRYGPHQDERHLSVRDLIPPVVSGPLTPPAPPPPAWRLWRLHHPDGTVTEHSFTPPMTLAEVRALYPDAHLEAITNAIQ